MRTSSIFESQHAFLLSSETADLLIPDEASKISGNPLEKAYPDFFVYRPKGLEEKLPWDFIDHGIYKEHLLKDYKLALKGEESDICRVGDCIRCGVC